MSTLQDRLDRIKAGFNEQAPPEVRAIMTQATEGLRASGIMDGLPAIGGLLLPFELPDAEGRIVRSADLLQRGPLVVTLYRGTW